MATNIEQNREVEPPAWSAIPYPPGTFRDELELWGPGPVEDELWHRICEHGIVGYSRADLRKDMQKRLHATWRSWAPDCVVPLRDAPCTRLPNARLWRIFQARERT